MESVGILCDACPDVGIGLSLADTDAPGKSAIPQKRCKGPCGEMKPVTAFHRATAKKDGYQSWCYACERPGKKVWQQAYWASGRRQNTPSYQRRLNDDASRKRRQQHCVYIVHLASRSNVFKIGHTVDLARRVRSLRKRYGPLQKILVIPCETSRQLEAQLHAEFQSFRTYEGAKPTELFLLNTAAGRKALARVLHAYPECVVTSSVWESIRTDQRLNERQGTLF